MSAISYSADYPSPIQELRERAYVNKAETERYDVKNWVNSVCQLYQQGDQAVLKNDLEKAYVSYMRGCSIMVGIIQVHSQFKEIYKDPVYVNLNKKTSSEIFPLLEDLAIRIDNWYKLSRQSSPAINNNFAPTNSNNGHSVNNTHFNVSPINHVATSNASYAFRPSHDPRNYPHYTLNDVPINTNQTTSPNGLLYPSSSSNTSLTPQPNMNVNNLTQSFSTQLKIKDKSSIPLPKWTNNNFPNTLIVQPLELANWMTSKHNPPSILIIDVRQRNIFTSGCIKHQWIIEIEPNVLSSSDQYSTIRESLAHNPNAEQVLFEEISNFDLVVYYDQSSKSLESASLPLLNLRKVLDNARLRRPAMMLAGGYDAWLARIGQRGVYQFASAKEKKHWFRNSNSSGTSSSSQSSHHHIHNPVYDYFTGKTHHHQQQYNAIPKPMPIPTAPRKESLTTRYHETLSPTVEKIITYPSQQPSPALIQHPQQQQQQQQPQDVRPVPPSYPKLHRRRTFIDNPFNGFTTTTSSLYDVPPIAYQNDKNKAGASTPMTQEQRPSSAEPINRPTTLHNLSASNLHTNNTTSDPSENRHLTSVGKTGLKNLGNTCYMNSILQCLAGTVPFIRFFTSGMYKQHINRMNKRGSGGILVDSFAHLVREMWSEKYNFISPMSFREVLGRSVPQFKGTDQQDSQEFLVVLMDKLHEDMNENSENRSPPPQNEDEFERLPDWKASLIAWDRYLSQHQSIIVSLFQGQYQSRLTCLSCKNTSTTYNVFMSLSLPIPAKKMRLTSVTLQQCLDAFVKEETLDKEDCWNCPKCRKKRKALKQLTLTRLPDILMIHLKRFSADGLFRNKLDATVKCPTRGLDLSNYVPTSVTPPSKERPSFVYDLYAVSNHFGSLSGGHYTACVRDMFQNNWSYFDDSRVTVCDESKVVTKAAYNLFYVRSTVKS